MTAVHTDVVSVPFRDTWFRTHFRGTCLCTGVKARCLALHRSLWPFTALSLHAIRQAKRAAQPCTALRCPLPRFPCTQSDRQSALPGLAPLSVAPYRAFPARNPVGKARCPAMHCSQVSLTALSLHAIRQAKRAARPCTALCGLSLRFPYIQSDR